MCSADLVVHSAQRITQPSEVVQALAGLLHQGGDVRGPCQVLRDVHTEVPIAVYSLHRSLIDPERSVMAHVLLPPEVHSHLLCLGDLQVLVVFAPRRQCLYLLQIVCLPAVGDQAYITVSSANFSTPIWTRSSKRGGGFE